MQVSRDCKVEGCWDLPVYRDNYCSIQENQEGKSQLLVLTRYMC